MGVHLQAPSSQGDVLWMACVKEMGELLVGQQLPSVAHVGLLPRVEGPHQDPVGVDVRPGSHLGAGSSRQ